MNFPLYVILLMKVLSPAYSEVEVFPLLPSIKTGLPITPEDGSQGLPIIPKEIVNGSEGIPATQRNDTNGFQGLPITPKENVNGSEGLPFIIPEVPLGLPITPKQSQSQQYQINPGTAWTLNSPYYPTFFQNNVAVNQAMTLVTSPGYILRLTCQDYNIPCTGNDFFLFDLGDGTWYYLPCGSGQSSVSVKTSGNTLKVWRYFYTSTSKKYQCRIDTEVKSTSGSGQGTSIESCDCMLPGTNRIVGGNSVVPNSLPYQALINVDDGTYRQECGGTVIERHWILTAAHCVTGTNLKIKATLGEHDVTQASSTRKVYDVEKVFIHENYQYTSTSIKNDIALLKLTQPIDYTKGIRAACLPKRNLGNLTGKSGRVSGWGTTSFGGPSPKVLQQTYIPIVDNTVCSQPNVYGNRFSTIDICAFVNGKDACQGDSGGPMALEDGGKTYVVGVTSYGSGCGIYPGVYTRCEGTKGIPGWLTTLEFQRLDQNHQKALLFLMATEMYSSPLNGHLVQGHHMSGHTGVGNETGPFPISFPPRQGALPEISTGAGRGQLFGKRGGGKGGGAARKQIKPHKEGVRFLSIMSMNARLCVQQSSLLGFLSRDVFLDIRDVKMFTSCMEEQGLCPPKTPVSLLHEVCSRENWVPNYEMLDILGAVHEPVYKFQLTVKDYVEIGEGTSMKKAKHQAARAMLVNLLGSDEEVTRALNATDLGTHVDEDVPGNPIGSLQELCMGHHWPPPRYDTIAEQGIGTSKKLAKRRAAHQMLMVLKDTGMDVEKLGILKEEHPSNVQSPISTATDSATVGVNHLTDSFQTLKLAKIPTLTPESANHVTTFLRSVPMPSTLVAQNYVSFLHELAIKSGFEVKYIILDECTIDDRFQCVLEIGVLPLMVSMGTGTDTTEAKEQAAKAALHYLHYCTAKKT
ncbi:unnamed protein product [Darwinula stevensoni]|uniref:limulus clotting factor C n=1 Tax=Darwinula stevensoni TaxID=69355 RepID=A0A7R9A754_9CRUS|nr:unnamed protein product [Darwinula stevensoni]CAG0891595.1 unnamed protein product [Darwinula stevensoni]